MNNQIFQVLLSCCFVCLLAACSVNSGEDKLIDVETDAWEVSVPPPPSARDLNERICTTNDAGNWRELGPITMPDPLVPEGRGTATGIGRIVSLRVDPTDPTLNKVYAGTAAAGLFYTENARSARPLWRELTAGSRLPMLGVQDVEVVVKNGQRHIYLATGLDGPFRDFQYGTGIVRSRDGGQTWEPTALSYDRYEPNRLTICTTVRAYDDNPDKLTAVCGGKIYRTTDGWNSKIDITPDDGIEAAKRPFRNMVRLPADPRVLLASREDRTYQQGGARLYLSRDDGNSWTELKYEQFLSGVDRLKPIDIALAVSPARPREFWVSAANKNGSGRVAIGRSLDGGKTWLPGRQARSSGPNEYYKNNLVVSPNDPETIYIGEDRIYRSTDGGENWRVITNHKWGPNYTHVDTRHLQIFDRGDQDVLLAGNDGGVSYSPDGGTTWDNWNGTGMGVTQAYRMDVAADYSRIVAGWHDMGFGLYEVATATWVKPGPDEDATGGMFHPLNPDRVFGTTFFTNFQQSSDGGRRWQRSSKGLNNRFSKESRPMVVMPSGRIFLGHDRIFTADGNQETLVWEELAPFPGIDDKDLYALAVSPDEQTIYAGFGRVSSKPTKRFFRSTDGGQSWTDLTAGLEEFLTYRGGGITDFALDPNDPMRIWVSLDRHHRDHKVAFSENGGKSWRSLSSGLPDFPVSAIEYRTGSDDQLFVATDAGVFYHTDGDDPRDAWQCFNTNLPIHPIFDLKLNYCADVVVAGSFGRGFWESPLPPMEAEPLRISKNTVWRLPRIMAQNLVVERGATLELMDTVHVAAGRTVTVERGGTLRFNGGGLRVLCEEDWGGLRILGKLDLD